MLETTGIATSGLATVVAATVPPDCASFHLLYSGLSFIIPLTLMYFLGAAMMFVGLACGLSKYEKPFVGSLLLAPQDALGKRSSRSVQESSLLSCLRHQPIPV